MRRIFAGLLIAHVAAGEPEANRLAREIADTRARAFDCKKDEPDIDRPRRSA